MEETLTYKDIGTLFCPTCNKPRDELIDLVGDGFAVLRIRKRRGEIIMGSKSIRKPFSNPKPKRQLPGDPNPGALPDPMPKPHLSGNPKPIPKPLKRA